MGSRVGFPRCQDRAPYCAILGHLEILYMCPDAPEGAKKAKEKARGKRDMKEGRNPLRKRRRRGGGSTEADRRDG